MIMKKIFTLLMMLTAVLGIQAQETWTIAGDKALMGSHWDPSDETNNMTTTDGKIFTLVKQNVMLETANYGFKACPNHGWDGAIGNAGENAVLTITENAAYTVTFTLDIDSEVLSAEAVKTGEYVVSETVWIVAGAPGLLGVEWKGGLPDGAANQMTTTDGKIFTLVKDSVALNIDTPYEYKYVKNESAWYGNAGDGKIGAKDDEGKDYPNFNLEVEEAGLYKVTFTLNSEELTASVSVERIGDATFTEKTWTICGVEDLCGVAWDPSYTNNDMVKIEEGYYELTREEVELEGGKDYEYKVAADHSWGESYGEGSENKKFSVEVSGTYDVTFSFIVATKTLDASESIPASVTAVKTSLVQKSVIYNLQGQRVKDGYRGIAIKNGHKVVIK